MSAPQIDGVLRGFYADGETGWGASMDANLFATGMLLLKAVSSVNLNAPVVAPDNTRHIVGTAPIGAWALHANQMARNNAATLGGYDFLVMPDGADVFNFADGLRYKKVAGVWVNAGATAIPTPHAGTHYPAPGGTNTDPIALASATQTGLMLAADKAKLDGYPAVPALRQTLQAANAGANTITSAVYANLISLPITVSAPGTILINFAAGFRNGVAIAATALFRIRVDGAVGNATVPGQGVGCSIVAGVGNAGNASLSLRITGLAPGAHTVNVDWASAALQTINLNQTTNPNTDTCQLVVSEVGV